MSEYKIKEYLLSNNSEFKNLFELHQKCERELAILNQNSTISSEEVLNIKILKKKKLSLKDSMQKMILEHSTKKTGQDF
ncbi:MAG: hypothetical protein ABFR36_01605 [Acidobacteriota bacterium]